ncbi:MAG TPA: CCA tRNA nucleotidyltransferase, partial [Microthrixaceae bacterium]|nr:CCA tRNA nucleotidyltransferase [Microthrixaceae bacterium]
MVPERVREVLDEVAPLAGPFSDAGFRLYLVGGVVRDLLAGRDADDDGRDLDLTTDATPDQIKALVEPIASSIWTQGERFGTIGARLGSRNFEITTHRAEAYSPDSRKPEVQFSTDIEADLSRRDYTVNAMALEVTGDSPRLIDPFDGAAHLVERVLRTPLEPHESFSDDPLRMIRAARFVAQFQLVPDAELRAAVIEMVARLEIVSVERIRVELDKLMVVDDPAAGLWFLVDTGLAEWFLPELPAMRVEQDPIHRHKDVLSHTIAVI